LVPPPGRAAALVPAGPASLVTLFIQNRDGTVRCERPVGLSFTVGRGASNDVRLEAPEVAERHARFESTDDGLFLVPLSPRGIFLAGRELRKRTAIDAHDLIRIGPFQIRLQTSLAESEPVPSPATAQPATPVAVPVALRRRIHRALVEHLDLVRLERNRMNDHMLRAKVTLALRDLVQVHRPEMPVGADAEQLVEELTHEAIGYGPLEELLADAAITEIMVVDPETIYVERGRNIERTTSRFTDEESVRAVLERIVTPLGRRIDESSPMLDARLPDGSRVNAIIRPLALRGTCITIRKFPSRPLEMNDLVTFGSLNPRIARFLQRSVAARKNILVSGGTGSGKTTLLNVLSAAISGRERIVTIEDSAELRLMQPHVVSLEGRPPNMEGRGEVTIRDLVRNAMRMRPDRIVVGECRGGEALDMLQAMNTGHAGSMTTTHANSPVEALKRIETLALMAGLDVPSRALREQIAVSLDLIVQQEHLSDGTRKVISVAEVVGLADDGQIETREVFGWRRLSTAEDGSVHGEFYASGYLPTYLGEFLTHGLVAPGEEIL
jgi:pilus assembly protein CpaF